MVDRYGSVVESKPGRELMVNRKKTRAQTIIEFTAGMVVLCLIIYGMVEVFRWGMMDMAERRYDHDKGFMNEALSVAQQLNSDFHQARTMDTLWYKNGTN